MKDRESGACLATNKLNDSGCSQTAPVTLNHQAQQARASEGHRCPLLPRASVSSPGTWHPGQRMQTPGAVGGGRPTSPLPFFSSLSQPAPSPLKPPFYVSWLKPTTDTTTPGKR